MRNQTRRQTQVLIGLAGLGLFAIGCSSPEEDPCNAPGANCGSSGDDTGTDPDVTGSPSSTAPSSTTSPSDTTVSTTEPTGGPSTDPGSESTATDGTETAEETGEPIACVHDRECDDDHSPLCLDGVCSPCTASATPDDACADRDAELGVCGNNGACVQCTAGTAEACTGATPWCDSSTNVCAPCTTHGQCGENGCAFDTGECLDACHLEVDGDGGQDATLIQAAVAMVDDGTDCTIVVHEQTGHAPYAQSVIVNNGKRIALLAAAGEHPIIRGSGGAGVSVSEASRLYARGLAVRQTSTYEGLTVTGAGTLAYVDDFAIFGNAGGGILVGAGGDLRVRNTMVGSGSAEPAVEVTAASMEATYCSFGGGFSPTAVALECGNPDSVIVRNSFLFGREQFPELACDDAEISYSASLMETPGVGNVALGPVSLTWFVAYESDLHLATPPDELATTAVWQSGDPLGDIDDDARPNVDGAADYAGADVP